MCRGGCWHHHRGTKEGRFDTIVSKKAQTFADVESQPQTLSCHHASFFLTLMYVFWSQFFSEYEKLLHSENYVTKRQSLKVWTILFLMSFISLHCVFAT